MSLLGRSLLFLVIALQATLGSVGLSLHVCHGRLLGKGHAPAQAPGSLGGADDCDCHGCACCADEHRDPAAPRQGAGLARMGDCPACHSIELDGFEVAFDGPLKVAVPSFECLLESPLAWEPASALFVARYAARAPPPRATSPALLAGALPLRI